MKKNLLSGFFLFTVIFVLGQSSDHLDGPKENIHLHLNKTTFLQGERLWFKAYIQDQNTKLPSLGTTNLHVGIYGDNGEEVKRKLLYVENGMAQGDFGIDSTLVDSEYTVLAWTNYMRNFKELEPFRQRIRILRDGREAETGEVDMKIFVFPEGGQLIAGAHNTMGFLVDNGLDQGVKVDNLELVAGSGNVIRRKIATNRLGMGKIGFFVHADSTYYLQRQGLNGQLLRQKLPLAKKEQFGIKIDNKETDRVRIEMIGSEALFTARDGEIFSIAVYQDEFIGFENFEVNMDRPVIWFPRLEMPYGALTAVLFDKDLKPIAHRMFFNHQTDFAANNLEVDYCLTPQGDSIQIDLILPKGVGQISNVSLSALPMSSTANNPNNSIISSFMLGPHTEKGFRDGYYFLAEDRQRRYELDIRLLIEGWGKYDWDSRKWEQKRLEFEMENGILIRGKIIDDNLKYGNQLMLHTDLSKSMEYVDLESGGSFGHNMNLFVGDSISFSLIGSDGNLRRSKVDFTLQEDKKGYTDLGYWLKPETLPSGQDGRGEPIFDQSLNLDGQTITLNEVIVSDKRISNKIMDLSPTTMGRLIGDEEIQKHKSLVKFLSGLGFGVNPVGGGFLGVAIMKYGQTISVPIYLEGLSVDANEIMGIALKDVKYVTYSKTPPGAFVSIALNENYVSPERRNQFIKFAIDKGYARPIKYFTPNYPDYSSNIFKTYGALDWQPNVVVGNEIPTSIAVPISGQNGIQLFIEGVVSDGSLVSQQEVLQIHSD